ncbi:hypothetical protein TBLA_0I01840 [Henningerozyma blattae CBS 6284]|uniref:AMP-dependent synthetase/ligase domain-containing protein n=1 Tax=Henningerozyma blattae (strain ATCC 34711 / CBS 6284 / DSM 70876 / NBRC 10599 / NRRL Y-10934 / UCD 77-7) TaxID=1071380 RepID=I2H8Z0_HENB6|nr:hypothetical protein TBLA_0I01840 [Tetrapisispora blattae CBS 6284]CCH62842.1 hypothetical protein TBLA_0I01840 [Tetrapisispora blattae CBS 6284]
MWRFSIGLLYDLIFMVIWFCVQLQWKVFIFLLGPCRMIISTFTDSIPIWLDDKYQLHDDYKILSYSSTEILAYIRSVRKNEFHGWDIFTQNVFLQPDSLLLIYIRPLAYQKGQYQLETYTYKDIYEFVLRLSYVLHFQYSICPGDRIGIIFTNKPLFILLWLALWNIGALPVCFESSKEDYQLLEESIKLSSISQLFIDPELSSFIRKITNTSKLRSIKFNNIHEQDLMKILLSPNSPIFLQNQTKRNSKLGNDLNSGIIFIKYSNLNVPPSQIKIRLKNISWRKIGLSYKLFSNILKIDHKSIVFTTVPLYHARSSMLCVWTTILQGGCTAIGHSFTTNTFWKQVFMTQATHIQYSGELCRYLLNTPPSTYDNLQKTQIAYGTGLRKDIWMKFKNRFHIQSIGEYYEKFDDNSILTPINFQSNERNIGSCRSHGLLLTFILSFSHKMIDISQIEYSNKEYNNGSNSSISVSTDNSNVFEIEINHYKNIIRQNQNKKLQTGNPSWLITHVFSPTQKKEALKNHQHPENNISNDKEYQSDLILSNLFNYNDMWIKNSDIFTIDRINKSWYLQDTNQNEFFINNQLILSIKIEDEFYNYGYKNIFQVIIIGKQIQEKLFNVAYIKLNNHPEDRKGKTKNLAHMEQTIENFLNSIRHQLAKRLLPEEIPQFIKIVDEFKLTDDYFISKEYYKLQEEFPFGSMKRWNELISLNDENNEKVFRLNQVRYLYKLTS